MKACITPVEFASDCPPLPELFVTTNPRDVMAPGFTYFGGRVIRRSGDGKAVWQRAQPYRSAAF